MLKLRVKKVKKQTYFFPPLTKGFPKGALPSGYHTSHPPNQDIFCDWNQCTDSLSANGKVLSCGYAFHDQCFINMGLKCTFCLDYFCSGIDELSKSYNERLRMNINIEEEFEESTQQNEEDVLSDETGESQNNNTIDKGLEKAISGIFVNFIKIIKELIFCFYFRI